MNPPRRSYRTCLLGANLSRRAPALQIWARDRSPEPVPRCFYAGRILEAPAGRNEDLYFLHVDDTAQARRVVRTWHAHGARLPNGR